MSSRISLLALLALSAASACSGARNESIKNLGSGERDGAADARQPEPNDGEGAGEPDVLDASEQEGGRDDDATTAIDSAPAMDAQGDASIDDAGSSDARVAEAAVDAAAPDAAPDAATPRIRFRLTRAGAPQKEQYVLLHGADGSLLGTTDTDADGRVETTLPVRSLTVALPKQDDSVLLNLFTYADVRDGDNLQLDLAPLGEQYDNYTLSIGTQLAGVDFYDVNGGPEGCGYGSSVQPTTPINVQSQWPCFRGANNALLVGGWTANHASLLGYALLEGLAAPESPGATRAASTGAFSAPRSVDQLVKDAPVYGDPISVELTWHAILRDQWLRLSNASESIVGSGTHGFSAPNVGFDAFVSWALWYEPNSVHHRFRVRSTDAQTPAPLELSHALPGFSAFEAEVNAGQPRVRWTSPASAERDAFLFEIAYAAYDASNNVIRNGSWAGLVRPEASEFVLPLLSSGLEPPAGGRYSLNKTRISAVRSTLVSGYDGMRQEPLYYYESAPGALTTPRLDAAGETEVVTWDFVD